MPDGSIIIDTKVDHSGLEKGLETIKSGVVSAGKMAAEAIAAATAALAAAGAAVVSLGSQYETSMAKASTLFGDVDVDMDNLNQKMLTMSSETGMAASQLGDALYSALSAGIPVTEDMASATEYLQACAELAVAGFTDVDTAVGATAKVLNAYKMDVSETDRVHKVLMATQNKGITTVGELSASLAQVTPTAAAMGVSFEQVGAALATMTAQGTPTAQATTQLNSLFAELGKSGTVAAENLKKATEGTKYAGMSFQDMMDAGVPLNEVLDMMGAYAEANGLSLLDMFSSIEAGKAALSMAGENAAQFVSNLKEMSTTADLRGDAYEKMMDTLEGQTNKLKESAKNLGIAIYNGASGKLKDVAKLGNAYVDTLQKAFNAGGVKGLVGALENVLGDVVSQASEFAPQMIDMAVELLDSLVDGIVDNADSIAQGLAKTLEAAVNGMTRILPNMISAGLQIAMKLVSSIADSLPTLIPQVVKALVSALVELVSNIPELIELGFKIVGGIAQGIFESIPVLLGGIGDAIRGLFEVNFPDNSGIIGNIDTLITNLGQVETDLKNLKENYTETVVKITLDYTNAQTLIDELEELQGKEYTTPADKERMESISTTLVGMYGDLKQYVGEDGILNIEADQVRTLTSEYKELALAKVAAEYVADVKAVYERAQVEHEMLNQAVLDLEAYNGKLDDNSKKWEAIKASAENASKGMMDALNFGDPASLEDVQSGLSIIDQYLNEMGGSLDLLSGTGYDLSLVFGMDGLPKSTADILQNQEAVQALQAMVGEVCNEANTKLFENTKAVEANTEKINEAKTAYEEYAPTVEVSKTAYEQAIEVQKRYEEQLKGSTSGTKELNDETANAGQTAQETGQKFELAGDGYTNTGEKALEGADDVKTAAGIVDEAGKTTAEATEGLETASGELATTKDTILATAADIKGAQDAATAAQTAIAEIVKTISTDAATALATMTETAASITLTAQGMMEAIQTAVTDSMDAIASAGADVADALLKAISDILTTEAGDTVADTFLKALKSGFTTRSGSVSSSASTVARSAIGSFSSVLSYGAGSGIGSNVASGIAAGIRNGQSSVISAATAIARAAINSAKKTLGINSPSIVMRDAVGKQISAGVSLGILDEEGSVIGSISKVASDLQSAMLGARMQDAVLQQGEFIRTRAVESGETEPRGGASGGGDNDSPIDYTRLAKAFWQEAPAYFQLQDLDGNYIGEIAEPTVSTIQSRRLKSRKKG